MTKHEMLVRLGPWDRANVLHGMNVALALKRQHVVKSESAGRIGQVVAVDDDCWFTIERNGKRAGVTRFGNEVEMIETGEKEWTFRDIQN